MDLAALTNSGLPASLVACKCETPEGEWQVNAEAMASHKFFKSCISTYKISSDDTEVAKACLHTILRAAIAHRRGKYQKWAIFGEFLLIVC